MHGLQAIATILETARENTRAKVNEKQREIREANDLQSKFLSTHTLSVDEHIEFLNRMVALQHQEQFLLGQYNMAVTLISQIFSH